MLLRSTEREAAYVRTLGRGTRLCLVRRQSALAATQFAHGSLRSHLTWELLVVWDGRPEPNLNLPFGCGIDRMREYRRGRPSSLPASSNGLESDMSYVCGTRALLVSGVLGVFDLGGLGRPTEKRRSEGRGTGTILAMPPCVRRRDLGMSDLTVSSNFIVAMAKSGVRR